MIKHPYRAYTCLLNQKMSFSPCYKKMQYLSFHCSKICLYIECFSMLERACLHISLKLFLDEENKILLNDHG